MKIPVSYVIIAFIAIIMAILTYVLWAYGYSNFIARIIKAIS